jgi:ubiquinone/menaquinone biosynthesis C-methylase UbiE
MRVLIPGCGFGDDAVRIAHIGAEVHAFDISPEIVEIAKNRSTRFNYENIQFDVMPTEALIYEDQFFDFVFCLDILHHVDISATIREFRRVLKPGGRIIGDELYTHEHLEKLIRKSYLVDKVLYPRLVKYLYGTDRPYITEDEHKIDNKEFAIILEMLEECRVEYFNIFVNRIVPERNVLISKIDRMFAIAIGRLGHLLAGRIVFDGVIQKLPDTPDANL